MSIQDRVHEIERRVAPLARNVLVLRLTTETLRLLVVLNDGMTLRVTERWANDVLVRYSYYWLDSQDRLKVGWDNAPHHTQLATFPHHKHIGTQNSPEVSSEVCFEDVIHVLEQVMARR